MLKRVVGLTIATVLGCALFASQATAAPVQCGDVITEDLKLEADLTDCPDDGLVVGADRITINLNGHEISNDCMNDFDVRECDGKVGIDNSGGYDRVRVRNGTVDGFGQTILLAGADRNTLANLNVVDSGALQDNRLTLERSDRNLIKNSTFRYGHLAVKFVSSDRNKITRTEIFGGVGVRTGDGLRLLEGSDANTFVETEFGAALDGVTIHDSVRNRFLRGSLTGVYSRDADRTVIAGNQLNGSTQGYGSLHLGGDRSTIRNNRGSTISVGGDRNLVVGNQAVGEFFETPIQVGGGDRNVVRGNEATSGPFDVGPVIWIEAAASNTTLVRNSASGGRSGYEPMSGPFVVGDGIMVDAPGTLVRANTATDNEALGINTVEGVIDGGDNHASGNGDPRQCVGVICTP